MYFGSPFGQDMILPALWQGLWQAFAAMGIMTGAFSNGALQDRFGRKIMFLVGGSVSAVGENSAPSRNQNIQDKNANADVLHPATAIAFVSSNPESVDTRRGILLLAKFILGIAMGIMMSSCQTYVSEISPARLRTVLLGFYPFFIVSRAFFGPRSCLL